MKKIYFGIIYELCLAALVILSLVLDLPSKQGAILDWFIWGIFILDYIIRLYISDNKWEYFKGHPLDFIAILPLDQFFRTARFVRIFRIIRLIMIMNRRIAFLDQLLRKYKIDTFVVSVMSILFLIALPMKFIEPSFDSYSDALWWAIVTMTTVGYGDLSPETTVGRIIASVLMLTGIGVIGLITGTVASIFTDNRDDRLPKELKDIKQTIDAYPNIDEIDYNYMIEKLQKMKNKHNQT
ncbi:potassium channel family protein [Bacillus sp. S/N-304-OC-R1]|uniref:potassium channel family protein n=1 Tax=Bacillus sp. S/N-304-OC-R1 TaxID=2758034 RepID=UPI001C8EB50E|nr:potassium channel family protein [Bacillus sp. S/N-304-OC-R1]MBY0121721.1 potassium channel family protein [Bacillus sp. S/N-304-OC-R1]